MVEYLKICLIRLSPEPIRVLIEFLRRTGLEFVGQTRAYLDDFADAVRSGNRKNVEEAMLKKYPNYHVKQFLTAFSIPAYFPSG